MLEFHRKVRVLGTETHSPAGEFQNWPCVPPSDVWLNKAAFCCKILLFSCPPWVPFPSAFDLYSGSPRVLFVFRDDSLRNQENFCPVLLGKVAP